MRKIHADQDACHNHTDTDTTLSTPASSTLREPSMSLDSSRRNLHRSSAQNWSETSVFAGTTQLPRGEGHRPTSWLLLYSVSPPPKIPAFFESNTKGRVALFSDAQLRSICSCAEVRPSAWRQLILSKGASQNPRERLNFASSMHLSCAHAMQDSRHFVAVAINILFCQVTGRQEQSLSGIRRAGTCPNSDGISVQSAWTGGRKQSAAASQCRSSQ